MPLSSALISCLTVTQPGRLEELKCSIRCFNRQTYAHRELVLVHDGDDAFDRELHALLEDVPEAHRRLLRAERGTPLGALRNLAVSSARGTLVCQWDDDDLYHALRLEAQHRHLEESGGDFCFLTDQLHWFRNTGEFFWDDWNVEAYPMNLIQGTLMGRRETMPGYPPLYRGEDTPVLQALYRQGAKLSGMSGYGYLYIYTYSGKNAWGLAHHGAISHWKGMRKGRLEAARGRLESHLADYGLPIHAARFPHEEGEMIIRLGDLA